MSLTAKQADLLAKKKSKKDDIRISVVSSAKEESKRESQNQSMVSGGMSARDTNQSFSK